LQSLRIEDLKLSREELIGPAEEKPLRIRLTASRELPSSAEIV